jgi:hypothetical protein
MMLAQYSVPRQFWTPMVIIGAGIVAAMTEK